MLVLPRREMSSAARPPMIVVSLPNMRSTAVLGNVRAKEFFGFEARVDERAPHCAHLAGEVVERHGAPRGFRPKDSGPSIDRLIDDLGRRWKDSGPRAGDHLLGIS